MFSLVPRSVILTSLVTAISINNGVEQASDGNAFLQLQATKTLGQDCPLPSNARWCNVRLEGIQGFQMAVYNNNDIVSNSICQSGTWELSADDIKALGAPGRALDIGANVGFYSLALAAAGWNVTAFEPMAANSALIQASICTNPQLASKVTLNSFGLGPKDDHCRIISGDDNVGDGVSQCGEDAKKPVQPGYSERATIDLHRLDDILSQEHVPSVDFVKMDVEGFECQVMAGGQSLLKKYRPRLIQSEVWPQMQGCQPAEYLESFEKAKYKVAKDRACTLPDATGPSDIENRYMCDEDDTRLSLMARASTLRPNGRITVWLKAAE